MRHVKLLVFLCVVAVVVSVVPQSWSLEPAQEEEYQRAQVFFKEGKLEDALSIFEKLANDNPSELKARLGVIDTTIEQAMVFKANKNPAWKGKVYKAFGELKRILSANQTSPEVYLSFAKCFWVNGRLMKADKSLKKALYYKPGYTEALIFKGYMYFEEGREITNKYGRSASNKKKKSFKEYRRKAKDSYEQVLAETKIDDKTKAMVYLGLGDTYHYLYNKKARAREQWGKAVSAASESSWGKKAQERLSALK